MAPTIVRDGQFRLFFFSREEARVHVHVAHPDGEAKFWLSPEVNLANHTGLIHAMHGKDVLGKVNSNGYDSHDFPSQTS